MRPKDRQQKIIDVIRQEGRVTVDDLATEFSSSAETIRRDLNVLASAGKIQKLHGGATLPRVSTGEGPFRERMGENVTAKRTIAKLASNIVPSGATIFIDTGSTTLNYAEEIASVDGLTVITNSTEIAKVVAENNPSNQVYLVGGAFSADNRETFGPLAVDQLRTFQAHYTVLTVGALDAKAGVTDFNVNEAQVARAMIDQSQALIVLIDSSKFDKIAPFKVCGLEDVDYLVCDTQPGHQLTQALSQHKTRVTCSAH